MNFQVDRGPRVVPNNPKDEMTSSSPASFPSLESPAEESLSSSFNEARRRPPATRYMCSVRFRSPRRFWDLVPLSVRQFLRNQSVGRDLVGMTLGITVGASIILLILFALVFVSKPNSSIRSLPYDFVSSNPLSSDGNSDEVLNRWLADYSRSVIPKPCHSHNDYWRPYPLFSALVAGCTGVEADIWLSDDGTDLLVGHDRGALSPNKTLRTMYLDPLMKILDAENPDSRWVDRTPYDQPRGAFKTDPNATLVLLVDVRSDPRDTWPLLVKQLEPLRRKQFLTRYEHIRVGPDLETKQSRWPAAVTVVGTGTLDRATFYDTDRRSYPDFYAYHDTFIDAPLEILPDENTFWRYEGDDPAYRGPITSSSRMWDVDETYMTSTSFKRAIGSVRTGFSGAQLARLRRQVRTARLSGLRTRYWDIPDWPIGYREYIWRVLVEEGVDLLNVDDLEGAARRGWVEGYVKDVVWMAVVSAYVFCCGFAMLVMWRRYLRRQWTQRIADANNAELAGRMGAA
ncbi:Altered inheritance of mitochondria protein [Colletotrichum tanaceti]|uniref:Altered inheritance of mitochondria protein 6 n=1 Tax=Colletotrichum tanaceti TaxID=1306861 RepID=A0A4U6XA11_9PEZI|nr:Altered inheritance of mitochondria protein [Colletotrichum tanaceti]